MMSPPSRLPSSPSLCPWPCRLSEKPLSAFDFLVSASVSTVLSLPLPVSPPGRPPGRASPVGPNAPCASRKPMHEILGRRGVPRLYGGWRDAREDRVYYVVQRAGSPIVVDEVSTVPSAAWLAFCRADPVVCTRRPFYVVSTPSTRLLDGVCSMRAGDTMSARWTSTPSTRRPLDSLVHTRRRAAPSRTPSSRTSSR